MMNDVVLIVFFIMQRVVNAGAILLKSGVILLAKLIIGLHVIFPWLKLMNGVENFYLLINGLFVK